ncbi:MAG: BLUF domain-containing protein [Pseudomonadota bacterium]
MRRLIYLSSAFRKPDQAMLDSILADARKFNSNIGVTGMLVAHGAKFLQVLEGESVQVEAVMKRVCASQKHGGIITLSDAKVDRRLFPEWTMGYERLSTDEEIDGFTTIAGAAMTFREAGEAEMLTVLERFFDRWADLPRSVIAEPRLTA